MKGIFSQNKYTDYAKKVYDKNKMQLNYLIFGIVTAVVNILTYYFLYSIFHFRNVPSTIVAWFLSVIVAYVMNKIWVFESKTCKLSVVIRKIVSFFSRRIMTGIFEVGLMWITVDIFEFSPMLMKIIATVMVIILNYIVSKMVVFKKIK